MSFQLQDYLFELPKDRIAQEPARPRDSARLFVIRRDPLRFEHRVFRELPKILDDRYVLVLNETRVIPARLFGIRRQTGGKVELLLVRFLPSENQAEAMVRSRGRLQPGEWVDVGNASFRLLQRTPEGHWQVEFQGRSDLLTFLERQGTMPLPPYIKRPPRRQDRAWYQTVYAKKPGAIAAPTAGLHFTPRVLKKLQERGVQILSLVLHVGVGTFRPIKTDDIREHKMDAEAYEIPDPVAEALLEARDHGKKILACGTTVTRALETWAWDAGPRKGWTRLFIYPPYRFKVVNALLTNFHLPGGTPVLLVSAFVGREVLLEAYQEAIRLGYRFFSYGDAMLIL